MAAESSRRDFLRQLAGQVSRGAGGLMQQALSDVSPEPAVEGWGPEAAPRAIPAVAPGRCASLDEACGLAEWAGLAGRRDEVLSICRWSLRLTPPDNASRLQLREPAEETLRVDLAAVDALGEPGLLPRSGQLTLAASGDLTAAGSHGERIRPCEVRWSPSPGAPGGPAAIASGQPLELTPELVLPRVWSDPVQALELEFDELEAWERVRRRLAELQGTLPFDGISEPQSLHRLLGYADERRGNMPLVCEMLAHGIDLEHEPAAVHPRAAEFEAGAARWHLLAQCSDDQRLGWYWGPGDSRLYVWIHEADLAAQDFSRVRAFAQ
jgi:hypothetical protein